MSLLLFSGAENPLSDGIGVCKMIMINYRRSAVANEIRFVMEMRTRRWRAFFAPISIPSETDAQQEESPSRQRAERLMQIAQSFRFFPPRWPELSSIRYSNFILSLIASRYINVTKLFANLSFSVVCIEDSSVKLSQFHDNNRLAKQISTSA